MDSTLRRFPHASRKKYRTFNKSIVNVQTYYMASELVREGLGCSITDIYTAAHSLPNHMIHEIKPSLSTTIYILKMPM